MLLNCGIGEDSWKSLGLQGDPTSPSKMKSVLNVHWKDWCWNSNTLATRCEELTHLKRPCCWERLKAGGQRDDRGWDGWMASLTQCTWVWASSRSWWRTGKPGMLQSMGLQRTGLNWAIQKQQIHKDLPESTGKSAEYPAMTSMGKESEMGIYNWITLLYTWN